MQQGPERVVDPDFTVWGFSMRSGSSSIAVPFQISDVSGGIEVCGGYIYSSSVARIGAQTVTRRGHVDGPNGETLIPRVSFFTDLGYGEPYEALGKTVACRVVETEISAQDAELKFDQLRFRF